MANCVHCYKNSKMFKKWINADKQEFRICPKCKQETLLKYHLIHNAAYENIEYRQVIEKLGQV